jgi:hypothetical protein
MNQTTVRAAIQRKGARLCRIVTILFVALSALLVLERFGAPALAFVRGHADGTSQRVLLQLVHASPEVLYLLGLWWIRQALAALAMGDLYAATLTRMIDRVGTMLAAGALVGVFIVPTASRVIGVDPGYLIAFDVSGLVLGAVGLSLKVFAHLFQHARAMQAELQEIF